ncbi:UbiA family prenyltransferase [Halopseudomonas salegens]|uniref:4-hydroxybenzoate polyprenyltransferase n=1 Tax=Halopseudomonas salegens TaxID=1434072 RepID=A0A1H2EGI8_9GAMM|nr:UbiA family prenyltransferase [Halopseudomonas salegens]SDT94119.1 4-hydroxybenzoate polyprenyltransferase [Halopseudomonas salegens]
MGNPATDDRVPLVIDLDGTLLHSDLLLESSLLFVRTQPWNAWRPLRWLQQGGKAGLKQRLAEATDLDVSVLPYNEDVLALAREAREQGRDVVLATASHLLLAQRIAEHLQLFDQVFATADGHNLSAGNKRDALVAAFGVGGFDYAGNAADDVPVWEQARSAILVNASAAVTRSARAVGNVHSVMRSPAATAGTWFKALRLHQWLKNLLIFVPLLAAHQVANLSLWLDGLLAFFIFGLCASSVYLLNDLLDLNDDRHHPVKSKRPFAAGLLSIRQGMAVAPTLLVIAFALALWCLPLLFVGVLLLYYLVTLAYSLLLKRIMGLDVIILASLYTLRIIAGVAALALTPTFWLLAFSMFIFLSLALVKRYTELREQRRKGNTEKSRGRGYYPDDLEMISSLGAASGYLSVMVLALYINDAKTMQMYAYPQLIWLACPLLLLWITRIWMLTHRGQMPDDPVVFAVTDRFSLLTGLVFALTFWIAV